MSLNKITHPETNVAVIEFSVAKDVFDNAVTAVYERKKKDIALPGFRKGKAPRHLIEKMYGSGFFYEDAINAVLPSAYEEAIKETDLVPVSNPEFDIVSLDDNGLVLSAKLYTKPEIEIKGYKELTYPAFDTEVTDDEINAEIEKLRRRNERFIDVTDRAAEMGDTAVFDFAGYKDGVAFEGGTAENQNLKLGSGHFIPGFEEQIVGKNIGEEFDVNVTFPKDYHAKELAGKAAIFKTKLNAIKFEELPVADDEFAKDVSEFDTLDEYKADLKAKMVKRNEEKAQAEFENAIAEALIEKLVADIPEPMFEAETENYVRDYDTRLRQSGLDLQTYFKYTGLTIEALREQMRPQAEKQVKMRLALEKIASLEELTVSDEEIEAEYKRVSEAYNVPAEQVKAMVAAEDIKADLLVAKAMDVVKSSAVVKTAAKSTK